MNTHSHARRRQFGVPILDPDDDDDSLSVTAWPLRPEYGWLDEPWQGGGQARLPAASACEAIEPTPLEHRKALQRKREAAPPTPQQVQEREAQAAASAAELQQRRRARIRFAVEYFKTYLEPGYRAFQNNSKAIKKLRWEFIKRAL